MRRPPIGLVLVARDLTPEQRQLIGVEQGGVLVESVDEGPAKEAGLRAGDLILMLDNQTVSDAKDFNRILDTLQPGRSVAVLVQRADSRMFYAIQMPKT